MFVVLEILGELFAGVLVEAIGRLFGAVFQSRLARRLLAVAISAALGFGSGVLWGNHVEGIGRSDTPRSVVTSLLIAGVCVLAGIAFLARRRDVAAGEPDARPGRGGWFAYLTRLSAARFFTLALISTAFALGVLAGFDPRR